MTEQHYARIADLYDSFVKTEFDIPFFIQEAKKASSDVLELMAGTGRVTIPLLQAGITLTCVDYSAEMLAHLQEKLVQHNLSADVRQMDIRHLSLDKQYHQIIIPFQAFPELTAEDDQLLALQQIHKHLRDDGTFICTLHNPVLRLKSADGQLHLAGRFTHEQNQLFVWLLQKHNPANNVVEVLEFFESYDVDGVMRTKHYSELQFHILEKATFEQLYERAGFACEALYGDYQYTPFDEQTSPFMIWLLKKKK